MKKSHIVLLTLFLGLTLLLSACVPGPRVSDAPGLALTDEAVFVAYGNFVYSLDATDSSVNWGYPENASTQIVFFAPPLVTEDAVYVGDLANNFYKLDLQTGQAEWTFADSAGFYLGQAAESDGVLYAPNNDGNLYALDADGHLLWTFETGNYLWSQPQISDDTIFIGSMDHFVYAISKDGDQVWSVELGGAVTGAPLLNEDGSVLFVGSMGKQMVALDAASGNILWSFDTEDGVWGTAILVDGSLYFADSVGNIYAVDAESGSAEWQTQYADSVVGGLTAIDGGFVMGTRGGVIKAYDFEGSPKWEATLDGEIYQAPLASSDFLVAGTIAGENLIYGFNQTGVQLWSTTPEK
ncbi:MAG: PQQ-binding-like beta-propeller repeat protein [Chloroflexota bacterium]|nr:PQQ-binding-like beta-propeller repeat protein [Chloroflexota bacterium]